MIYNNDYREMLKNLHIIDKAREYSDYMSESWFNELHKNKKELTKALHKLIDLERISNEYEDNWGKYKLFKITVCYWYFGMEKNTGLLQYEFDNSFYPEKNKIDFQIQSYQLKYKSKVLYLDIEIEHELIDDSLIREETFYTSAELDSDFGFFNEYLRENIEWFEKWISIAKRYKTYKDYFYALLDIKINKNNIVENKLIYSEEYEQYIKEDNSEQRRYLHLQEILSINLPDLPTNRLIKMQKGITLLAEGIIEFVTCFAICRHFNSYNEYMAAWLANDLKK